jgi:hypothetical protein
VCEARSSKRSTDAAYRLARRQLSSYHRPVVIASAENRNTSIVGPVQFDISRSDSSKSNIDTSYGTPTMDWMGYQQQQSLELPVDTTKDIQLTPQSNMLPFLDNTCDFSSPFPLAPAPGFSQCYGSPYSAGPNIKVNPVGEDFVYSSSSDDTQASDLSSTTPGFTGFASFPLLDYPQLNVPLASYTSLAGGQNLFYNSLRPSRSLSLNSSRSSTI